MPLQDLVFTDGEPELPKYNRHSHTLTLYEILWIQMNMKHYQTLHVDTNAN